MATLIKKETARQIVCDGDRTTIRECLTKRIGELRREKKRAGSKEEESFYEGGEMEIFLLFDELLGEQPPEKLPRRPRSH